MCFCNMREPRDYLLCLEDVLGGHWFTSLSSLRVLLLWIVRHFMKKLVIIIKIYFI